MEQIDYKKKYDDLINRLNDAKETKGAYTFKSVIDEVVPVEREDERIRKWIYTLVNNLGEPADEDAQKELDEMQPLALAWLEKQGEAEYVFRPLAGCDIFSSAEKVVEKQRLGGNYVLAFNGVYIPVGGKTADEIVSEYFSWLEKKGEQKLLNNDKYQTVPVKILDRLYESEKELERLKQSEQNLYVNDNAKEMFIKALERVEEQNSKGYKLTDCDKNSWWEDFKAYTSCTIEQKPTDKVEPMFKVKYAGNEYNVFEIKELSGGITFYGIEDEPNHIDYIKAESCEMISGYTIKENGFPYPTKPAVFSKQKPAWSEEDENAIKVLMSIIKKSKMIDPLIYTDLLKEKLYNWLKSIKERMKGGE